MTLTTMFNVEGNEIEITVKFEDYILNEFGPSNAAYRTCSQLKEKLTELQISFDDKQLLTLCGNQFEAQHEELYADHKTLWAAYWEMRTMWDCEPGHPGWPFPSNKFNYARGISLKNTALQIIGKYGDLLTWEIQKFYWDKFNFKKPE